MGRVKDMYMLMRLSYDQAEDDFAEKKTTNVVESYKKYHIENLGHESSSPEEEVRMFSEEDFNDQFNVI
tara:strand:- start:376 stop:582 length:207 start_codon:yes stop_codon:yes gene_type:complete